MHNIEYHFQRMSDPTVNELAVKQCKQRPGESANAFYVRLSEVMGPSARDDEKVKVNFLSGLRDKTLMQLAVANRWGLYESVEASARIESMQSEVAGSSPLEVAAVDGPSTSRDANWRERGRQGAPSRAWSQGRTPDRGGFARRDESNQRRRERTPRQGDRCKQCARDRHGPGGCPASSATCRGCGKVGHFVKACPSAKGHEIHEVNNDDNM
jgi:hypothetical protein